MEGNVILDQQLRNERKVGMEKDTLSYSEEERLMRFAGSLCRNRQHGKTECSFLSRRKSDS